jgi:hypothetical protein
MGAVKKDIRTAVCFLGRDLMGNIMQQFDIAVFSKSRISRPIGMAKSYKYFFPSVERLSSSLIWKERMESH